MKKSIPLDLFLICFFSILIVTGVVYFCLYPLLKSYCIDDVTDCAIAYECTDCDSNGLCNCKYVDGTGEIKDIKCKINAEDED